MKTIDNKAFVKRLRQLFADSMMTQAALAEKTGLSYGTIHRCLHGRCVPYPANVDSIAKALVTTAEYLLFGKGQADDK